MKMLIKMKFEGKEGKGMSVMAVRIVEELHRKRYGKILKTEEQMEELKICYIEQFGYDVVIGLCHGLNLGTILKLEKISKENGGLK